MVKILFATTQDLSGAIDNGEKQRAILIINKLKSFNHNIKINDFKSSNYDIILVDNIEAYKLFNMEKFPNSKKFLLMDYIPSIEAREEKTGGNNKYIISTSREEIEIMNKFDKVVFISPEEALFFNKILKVECCYLPYVIISEALENTQAKYDLIFTASNSPKNLGAINWFLKNVYPILKINKMVINGGITKSISDKEKYKKIDFINWTDDLRDVYSQSRIAIAPMFQGTGVKIKVLTALSYGIPVIGTSRATQGMLKKENVGFVVCDNPVETVFAINNLLVKMEKYNQLKKQALEYVDYYHNEEAFTKKLTSLFPGKHLSSLLSKRKEKSSNLELI